MARNAVTVCPPKQVVPAAKTTPEVARKTVRLNYDNLLENKFQRHPVISTTPLMW